MGLGILEDKVMDHVPGTTRYYDDPDRPQRATDDVRAQNLKCDNSGPVPIILVPQPSDDPNDPLNWPLWKRDLITFILSVTAIFATALGPILAANTITLALYYRRRFADVALLTGYFLLGVGAAAIFVVPSARVLGKRHMFVIGTIGLVVTSVWGGAAANPKNYNALLVSRVFQGFFAAPFESLVNAAVGDLYFVHERGLRMAFTNLAVFGGAFFTPILVGKITHTIMWWWTFYLTGIFCAVCVPLVFFFCPETAFRRDSSLNLDLLDRSDNEATDAAGQLVRRATDTTLRNPQDTNEKVGEGANDNGTSGVANGTTSGLASESNNYSRPKKSFVQSLALFDGRKTDENFFKLLLRPFPLFLQPAFLWACLIQGLLIGWTVFIGVTMAHYFLSVPLWWGEVETGYAYTGAFVGALLGFAIAGLLADWSARFMTKLNGGVYEPEFRILLVIPAMILGCAGLFGWGITIDGLFRSKYHYAVPLTFFGLEVAGMVIGAVASSLYIVDAYRDLAIEGFTCMIIFKNIFSFALTFKAYDWLIANRTLSTPLFNKLGIVQVVICLTSIPLYVFGKRLRSYFHRHDLLAMFGVR